jgi:hypothetical protein
MPAGATVVVLHTAVLAYLPSAARDAFVELVGELPVRWISQEGAGVLPSVRDRLPAPPEPEEARFLSRDQRRTAGPQEATASQTAATVSTMAPGMCRSSVS